MPQPPLLRPFWENGAHLAVIDDLHYVERIVIPQVLRLEVLDCMSASIVVITTLVNVVQEPECQFGGLGYLQQR